MHTSPWTHAAAASSSALLLTLSLAAQQTWTVDMNNGPGANFTDLPAAVAAAEPGDTLIVRSGLYTSFVLSEGLIILGEDNVTVQGGFRVTGLPDGPPAILRNILMQFSHPVLQVGYELTDNTGAVFLDDVDSEIFDSVKITNCQLVTLRACRLTGGTPSLKITDSNVHLDSCEVLGAGALLNPVPGSALECEGSTVHVGVSRIEAPDELFAIFPTEAIHIISGTLVLGAETTVEAGSFNSGAPVAAIRSSGGTLILDDGVTPASTGGAPPITGPVSVINQTVPAVQSDGGVLGGPLSGRSFAPPGSLLATFLNLPTTPVAAPPFGTLWVADPLIVIDGGVVPASGDRPFSVVFPVGLPPGLPIAVQAAVLVTGFPVRLSTPSTTVLGT